MITCREFGILDEFLQTQFILTDGIFLMGRKTEKLYIELYALHSFYVELYFFKENNNNSLYIKAFENVKNLDLYIEQININKVLELTGGGQ